MDDVDPDILKGIQAGDRESLAAFLEARKPQLMAFINRRLGAALKSKVEPEDIFQELGAEALRTLTPEWPGERDPFSWLCQTAERRIVDAHRHHFGAIKRDAGREQSLDRKIGGSDGEVGFVNLLVRTMTTPSQAFSRNAREARLAEAVSTLSEDQQTAIRMKYVESKPSKEIAAELGKSDAAVRVMLTRTMKQLHEMLEDTM